ncbi:MAG: small-conductance mechanosensitive channel [Salibacteraceae bacterium]|jgi:small-conductance mechanosensitive channel
MELINDFLDFQILRIGDHSLQVYNIAYIIITVLITKVLIWVSRKAIFKSERFNNYDQGNIFALFKIFTYVIWIIAFTIILESIGVKMSVLLAGSAALMVGIGLGLQQTFNDIVSGIILLFEGTTKVGDLLEVDNEVIIIQHIGLRTSKGINRDDIVIIIPNSQITTSKVINWSHNSKKTRFHILVGVAYGSNVDLVMNLLKESVIEHPEIKASDFIEVRFIDFGASSLDFKVLFFNQNSFRIEKIKSDIRIVINRKFNANNITIPFQQVDLHVKSNSIESAISV